MASSANGIAALSTSKLTSDWLQQFLQVSPPLLDHTATIIRTKKDSPAASIPWLVGLCDEAPGLGIALMLESNRALARASRPACLSAHQMCLLLGLPRALEIASQVPLLSELPTASRIGLARCYSSVFLAKDICNDWHSLRADIHPEELHGLILIHAMTEMLLWMKAPEQLQGLEAQPELFEFELPIGASLDQIGVALIDVLPLPAGFRDSLETTGDGQNPTATAARLAYIIARMVHRWGWQQPCLDTYLQQSATLLGCELSLLNQRLHSTSIDSARVQPVFDEHIKPAAFQLLLLPPVKKPKQALPGGQKSRVSATTIPLQSAKRRAGGQAIAEQANKATPARAAKPGSAQTNGISKASPKKSPPASDQAANALQQCVRVLRQATPGQTPQGLLRSFLKGLHEGLQFNTVFVLLISKDHKTLTLRCLYEQESIGVADGDRFELAANKLFKTLLEQSRSLHLKSANRSRYRRHLPEVLAEVASHQELLVRPLIVNKRPIALVLSIHPEIGELRYQQFNQLCEMAMKRLNEAGK